MTPDGRPTDHGPVARAADLPGPAGPSRPPFLARQAVALAVHVLPAGDARRRYQQELLAELYELEPRQATACALGIALNAPALRAAVKGLEETKEITMHNHRPLVCRLNIHHHYRIERTEDGDRYWHCPRCGKDYFSNTHPGAGTFTWSG